MGDEVAGDIAIALAPRLGGEVEVSDLRALTSGASRQSWRFEASGGGFPARPYVLQREMVPASARPAGEPAPLGMGVQGLLLERAAGQGVPVPPLVATGEMHGLGYLITEWLEGEALPPRMLRDPGLSSGRARLTEDCAAALAGIHRIDPGGLDLQEGDRLSLYRHRLDQIGEPRPVLELAYRWWAANQPQPGPAVVVHGDFRLGNLLVGPHGLQAVLDWEIAHLGDRHEDVAWATLRPWRFDRHRERGTFPEPAPWVEAYNAAAGPGNSVVASKLLWWQVAGTWTWAVMSAMQARRHLDGWVDSLEHATIGRRVCESEWDLLELLPGGTATPAAAPKPASTAPATPATPATVATPATPATVASDRGDLHGRPTVGELLAAVRSMLSGRIAEDVSVSLRHQVRIAVHALEVVCRELELGPAQEQAHRARLAALGATDDAALARAIRAGRFDPRDPTLRAALEADTRARLEVANPLWLPSTPG
ncbi:MAG: phosphotransferase family protein [Acidimicrobiales bacterium]